MKSGESAPLLGKKAVSSLRTPYSPMVFPGAQGHNLKASGDRYMEISGVADRPRRDHFIRYDES